MLLEDLKPNLEFSFFFLLTLGIDGVFSDPLEGERDIDGSSTVSLVFFEFLGSFIDDFEKKFISKCK